MQVGKIIVTLKVQKPTRLLVIQESMFGMAIVTQLV